MGNAKSTSSVKAPLALDENAHMELDRLSFIADRFLGSSEFYDVGNLVKPGSCGNFAIIMRKGIENVMMPFVVDLSDGKTAEVFYVDPLKAMTDYTTRKKICKELAETMVHAIAIVTACLASIQIVKSHPREAILAANKQGGGAKNQENQENQIGGVNNISTVGQWLEMANFIKRYERANVPVEFHVPGGRHLTPDVRFTLTLLRSEGVLSYGLFHAVGTSSTSGYPMGSMPVQFLFPIQLPGSQTKVLPIRLVDNAGLTWASGILIDGMFKSFLEKTAPCYITEILQRLFQTASGWKMQDRYPETRTEIELADTIFNRLHKSQDPQEMFKVLGSFFYSKVSGYQGIQQPGYVLQPQQPGYIQQPGYVQQAPVYYPQQQPGYYQQQQQQQSIYRPQQQQASIYAPALRQQGPTGEVDIYPPAAIGIKRAFEIFRKMLATQACPAEERIASLIGSGPDAKKGNLINTGICADPYWKKSNLSDIYPWATFEFLSTKVWDTYGDRNQIKFESEWRNFIDELVKIYAGKLTQPRDNYQLDQMRFVNTNQFPICTRTTFHANVEIITDGITNLHKEYDQHSKLIWRIVNDIVIRVKHPETGKDVIRFHPNVIGNNKSSAAYIRERADAARAVLKEHYLAVEKIYTDIAKNPNL